MTPIEQQKKLLDDFRSRESASLPTIESFPNGAWLVKIPDVKLVSGWNRQDVTILFVAPPGYPGGQPDCFWVEPGGFRLQNGATPLASNDSNPVDFHPELTHIG